MDSGDLLAVALWGFFNLTQVFFSFYKSGERTVWGFDPFWWVLSFCVNNGQKLRRVCVSALACLRETIKLHRTHQKASSKPVPDQDSTREEELSNLSQIRSSASSRTPLWRWSQKTHGNKITTYLRKRYAYKDNNVEKKKGGGATLLTPCLLQSKD